MASQFPVKVAVLVEHSEVPEMRLLLLQQQQQQPFLTNKRGLKEEDVVEMVVPVPHHIRSVCDNPQTSEYTTLADVWICESKHSRDSPSSSSTSKDVAAAATATAGVVIAQSRLVLYPTNDTIAAQIEAFQQVYPSSFRDFTKPWMVRIVTDRKDWQDTVTHLSTMIQDTFEKDPLVGVVGPPEVQVLFRNLTRYSIVRTKNSPSKEANDTLSDASTFQTRRLLLNIDALWDSLGTTPEAIINWILPQDPMDFVQPEHPSRSSHMAQRGDASWAVLVDKTTTSEDPHVSQKSLEQAFHTSLDLLRQYVWSIPPSLLRDGSSRYIHTDGITGLPTLYESLWHQRTYHHATQSLLHQAQHERTFVTNLPYNVPVTEEVSLMWRKALQYAEDVPRLWAQQHYAMALQRLDRGMALLHGLSTDPTLLEPLTVPWDQLAAIFAPLLVPLLLPILTGLVREVKRYKELQRKRRQHTHT